MSRPDTERELIQALKELIEVERRQAAAQEIERRLGGANPFVMAAIDPANPAPTPGQMAHALGFGAEGFWGKEKEVNQTDKSTAAILSGASSVTQGFLGSAGLPSGLGNLLGGAAGGNPIQALVGGAQLAGGMLAGQTLGPNEAGRQTAASSYGQSDLFRGADYAAAMSSMRGYAQTYHEKAQDMTGNTATAIANATGLMLGGMSREQAWETVGKKAINLASRERAAQESLSSIQGTEGGLEQRLAHFFQPFFAAGVNPGKDTINKVLPFFQMQAEAQQQGMQDIKELSSQANTVRARKALDQLGK